MTIDLTFLNYSFQKKPLLVGGKAMEYYGLRKAGNDIDLIISKDDFLKLVNIFPHRLKDLWGDLGICLDKFEIWKTISYFSYEELVPGAIEENNYLVISLEKHLLLKSQALKKPKYLNDLKLIADRITQEQQKKYRQVKLDNNTLLSQIPQANFIEIKG